MDKLFTQKQARVLTPEGFYKCWLEFLAHSTREKAYEATERLHQEVHESGSRKYSDFNSFEISAWRFKKRQKQTSPTV